MMRKERAPEQHNWPQAINGKAVKGVKEEGNKKKKITDGELHLLRTSLN